MDIGKYKQAMSYLLNPNSTLKTFALNPNAKLSDNDPPSLVETFANGGRVGFKNGDLAINELPTDVPQYKGSRLENFKKNLKALTEWKKNPTAYNWIKAFGYKTESGQNKQTEFARDLRSYIRGNLTKQTTKELFDRLKIKNYLKNNIQDIKDLDESLVQKRQMAATQARAQGQLEASLERIEPINEQFKKNPNIGLEELTKNIYGKEFTKADDVQKLKLATQVSDDVGKYLEALQGAREGLSGMPTGNKLKKIIDTIESNTPAYRFREGVLRNYKFNVADEARGFDFNYTQNLRNKIVDVTKRVVDEPVGLSATFKDAPGYLESTQFLKQKTNEIKSKKIDKPFSEAFSAALEGDTSKVANYNKEALKFKTRFPDVDVPFIKYGDKLSDVKKHVKHFDDFSDASKENILNIAKEKGIVIKTNSLPLQVLANKYLETTKAEGLDRVSKLKEIGLSPRGHALNIDVIPGLSALSKTQAANVVGKLALGFSNVTGAPVNAALGALLNTPEMREKGFGRLDASLLGATKGVTQDLANFLAYAYRTPEALYKTFKEDPKTKKVRLEQFLENLGPQKFEFMDKITDNLSERISTKEYIDNLAQLEYEKELQKVMPSPSISETEVFDTDQYLNEELFKKKYKEKIFKQFPEFKQEYYFENKEPLITPKEGVFDFNISDLTQPQELAEGGRVKLKNGTDDPDEKPIIQIDPLSDDTKPKNIMDTKLSRRQVLGGLGVAAGLPVISKLMQEGKAIKATKAANVASKIKFEQTQGMYPWFPKLVEKIKVKGQPFEEKELIMEASYKHEPKGYGGLPTGEEKLTKHVDGDTTFILREYPDGRIAVDIHSPRNQEGLDTPVTLYYRPTMELNYYSGKKIEPAEFKVLEKEPRYFANGPDDVDIEMSEARKVPNKDTIYGDVEAAERFATGKIENRKIIRAKQMRRDQMTDQPVDFIEETSPYGPVYD